MADLINHNVTENIRRYLECPNNGQAILIEGPWGCGKTYFIKKFIENEESRALKLIRVSLFGIKSIAGVEDRILHALYPILENKLLKFAGASAQKISTKFGLDFSGDGRSDAQATFSAGKINLYALLVEGRNKFALILDDIERTSIKPQDLLGYINYIVETNQIRTILIANESELWKSEAADYRKFKEKVISRTFHIEHDAEALIENFLKGSNSQIGKFKPIVLEAYAITNSRNLRSLQQVIDDFSQLYQQLDSKYKGHEEYTNVLAKTFFSLGLSIKCASTEQKDLQSGEALKSSSAFMKKYFPTGRPVLSGDFWLRALSYSDFSTLNLESSKQHFFDLSRNSEMDTLDKIRHFEDLENSEFQKLLSILESEVKNGKGQNPFIYIKKVGMLASLIKYELSDINPQELASYIRSYIHYNEDLNEWKNAEPERLSGYESEHIDASHNLHTACESFYAHWVSAYEAEQLKRGAEQRESKASEFYQALMVNDRDTLIKILNNENPHTAFLTTLNAEHLAQTLLVAPNAAVNSLSEVMGSRYSQYMLRSGANNSLYSEISFWDETRLAIEAHMGDAEPIKKYNLKRLISPAIANFRAMLSIGIHSEQG